MKYAALSLALGASVLGSASPILAALPSVSAAPAATIWYSEEFVLHSKSVGRDFLIQVARPHKPQPGKVPAVYLLDGDEAFGEVADMEGSFGEFGDAAPAYVIGIAYPERAYADWIRLREHDFLHVAGARLGPRTAGFGEGGRFQDFLLKELRPAIEARYPVDPKRTVLIGHSFGGLFAAHVLLNTPKAFQTYLIASPSLWAEPGLLDKAAAFRAPDPVKVFIGVGSKEEAQFAGAGMVTKARALADRLRSHPSNAEVGFYEVEGENHGTSAPALYARGLQFALPGTAQKR